MAFTLTAMGASGVVFIERCLLLVCRDLGKGPRLALLFWKVQPSESNNTTTISLTSEIMPIECTIVRISHDYGSSN